MPIAPNSSDSDDVHAIALPGSRQRGTGQAASCILARELERAPAKGRAAQTLAGNSAAGNGRCDSV